MANENGNKIKLLVLWDILCKNTDENHAMNSDEIREELAKRGISVMRKVVATDIAALNKYGYALAILYRGPSSPSRTSTRICLDS